MIVELSMRRAAVLTAEDHELLVRRADGRVQEFVGGYEDWLRQRAEPAAAGESAVPRREKASQPIETARAETSRAPRAKLSYREQQELKQLPAGIETLEAEQRRLEKAVAAADFYKEPADTIKETLARIEAIRGELVALYARWDELDGRTKP